MTAARKLVWIGAIVLLFANAGWLTLLYNRSFSENHIKRYPLFAARQQQLLQTMEKQAALLSASSFSKPASASTPAFENFFTLVQSQDVFRVKAWNLKQQVIWSNASEEVGKTFQDNPPLREALKGQVVTDLASSADKDEQQAESLYTNYSETYVPVRGTAGQVVGAVEVYQVANDVIASIRRNFYEVAVASVVLSALLVVDAFGITRHK